jgi:hypothetical protein
LNFKQDKDTLENQVGKAMQLAKKLAQYELIKATKQKGDSLRGDRGFDGGNSKYLNAMLESIVKVREEKKADADRELAILTLQNNK